MKTPPPYQIKVDVSRGAPMGRPTIFPRDKREPFKLHLRRVPLVDYAYDQGGAYWGGPTDLWCAWADGIQIFTRASTRDEAKADVREYLPNARFYR